MTFIPFILLGLVLLLLLVELFVVQRIVRSIPIRVHVNGSRGKSSVTRYIVAGLRSGGKRTVGKITGIQPTILLPDGQKSIIQRRAPANVREQIKLARLAKKLSCDALVLECMSISSPLQQVESDILQPHVTVLTNILEDHLEELGSSDAERTEAYCSAFPSNAVIVTNDQEHIIEVEKAASQRNTKVIVPPTRTFPATEFILPAIALEHISLALTACTTLGVDEELALRGILGELQNDEPLLYSFTAGHNEVRFINGFAVNDVPSAKVFLESWRERLNNWSELVFVLNTRSDRPRRSVEFARWCSSLDELKTIILTGTHIPLTKRMLRKYGIPESRIQILSKDQIREPQKAFGQMIDGSATVFGFCNIAGDGFAFLDAIKPYQQQRNTSRDH